MFLLNSHLLQVVLLPAVVLQVVQLQVEILQEVVYNYNNVPPQFLSQLPQEVKGIIEEYDVDGNDSLDFSEFLMLTAKLDPRIGQEIEINKAFKLFDKDNNGYITRWGYET